MRKLIFSLCVFCFHILSAKPICILANRHSGAVDPNTDEIVQRHYFVSGACFLRELDLGCQFSNHTKQFRTVMVGYRFPMTNHYWLFENPDINMQAVCGSYAFDMVRQKKHTTMSSSIVVNCRYNFYPKGWLSHYDHYSEDYSWLITREREDLSVLWRVGWCTSPGKKFFFASLFEIGPRVSLTQTTFFDERPAIQNNPNHNIGFAGIENGFGGGFEFRIRLMIGGGK